MAQSSPGRRPSGHQFPNDSFKGGSMKWLVFRKPFRYSGSWNFFFTNTFFHSHCQSLSSNTKKSLWNFKIRKDSLPVASFSWTATCTQVSVSVNEKLSGSSFIFLYFFFFLTAYTSWAISTSVNKMVQHTLPLKTNEMACFTKIKIRTWNVITPLSCWFENHPWLLMPTESCSGVIWRELPATSQNAPETN